MSKERPEFTLAEQLFMQASATYPASITAQAAFIALECKNTGINPTDYIFSLAGDDKVIERICNAAEKAHSHLERLRKPLVTLERMKQIIVADFSRAEELLVLDKDQLKSIADIYSSSDVEAKVFNREIFIAKRVEEMIDTNLTPTL